MIDQPQTASRAIPDTATNLDAAEVARFAALAAEWWDPRGKFRPLHQIGPVRLGFIRDRLVEQFRADAGTAAGAPRSLKPLAGLKLLDIGCGGGLIAEPLARLGGIVTAIDPAEANIAAARAHAEPQGLAIDYRAVRVEDLIAEAAGRPDEGFDAVICLEVVEHVPDVGRFLADCARLVRPGGLLVLSTLNRTLKSFALAIVGAEYVLRWLPIGTHQWHRFVTPDELDRHLAAAGLRTGRVEGMVYDPLADRWLLSRDTDVNYLCAAVKPGA